MRAAPTTPRSRLGTTKTTDRKTTADRETKWGASYGDSPQAVRAVELFLKQAPPAAAIFVDDFLSARRGTLDEFLLTNLRRSDAPGEEEGVFVRAWQAFARGATKRARSNAAERAWTQWRAFGGEDDRALPLHAMPAGEDGHASCVERTGVVRIDGCLSAASAEGLRDFVLATRDEGVALAAKDKEKGAERLSRVLSARDVDSEAESRWDVRLPWSTVVRDAVHEMMGARDDPASLGHALSVLSGGDSALLFECAAVVSTEGCAPQIVHADTVPSEAGAVLHTAFVALQDISAHQGPTRFLPHTHTCSRLHGELEQLEREHERGTPESDLLEGAPSVVALLRSGDCTLYDSRTLHCGGPHVAPPDRTSLPEEPVERVLFYVSFKHALATEAELANTDVHGAGSILPAVAAMRICLGSVRRRGV